MTARTGGRRKIGGKKADVAGRKKGGEDAGSG